MIWGDFLLRNIPTVYVLEMLVPLAMFARRMPRRSKFSLRVAVAILGAMAVSVWLPDLLWAVVDFRNFSMILLLFLLLLAVMVAGVLFCFRCSRYDGIFCGIAAYAVQNGIYQTLEVLQLAGEQMEMDFSGSRPAAWAILAIVHISVYWGVYSLFARDGAKEHYPIRRGELLGLSAITLVIVLRVLPNGGNGSTGHAIAWLFLHILCCALSLYILVGMSENGCLRKELDTM